MNLGGWMDGWMGMVGMVACKSNVYKCRGTWWPAAEAEGEKIKGSWGACHLGSGHCF